MIEYHGYEILKKHLFDGCSIVELGNQIMNLAECQGTPAKDFIPCGSHTSIDQNGLNGALKLSLCEPINLNFKADIVTDFGTTEHVEDLFECLSNVFEFCKAGGVMIHKNPKTGNFPNHGFHFFTVEFWQEYANLCGLKIELIEEHAIYHNTVDGWEVIAVLRKTKRSKKITKEVFETIKHLVKNV